MVGLCRNFFCKILSFCNPIEAPVIHAKWPTNGCPFLSRYFLVFFMRSNAFFETRTLQLIFFCHPHFSFFFVVCDPVPGFFSKTRDDKSRGKFFLANVVQG